MKYISKTILSLHSIAIAAVVATPKTSSILQVTDPLSLAKPKGYDHTDATFGPASYQDPIEHEVIYLESELCYPNIDLGSSYPARVPGDNNEKRPLPSSFILMANRGSCTFQTKVRNAQRVGAAALIVADNACRCSDEVAGLCNSRGATCEKESPFMGDDGSGHDIHIPSMLMSKHDAESIKMKLVSGHSVRLEIAWMVVPTKTVQYNLWTTPARPAGNQFLLEFKNIALALKDSANFKPYSYIGSGCQLESMDDCQEECTNGGRYCASTASDGSFLDDLDLTGNVFVKETLRRHCIWKEYGEDDGVGEEWWNYVVTFIDKCYSEALFDDEDCIVDVYKHSGVDKSKIDTCLNESGGLDGDIKNTLLEEVIMAEKSFGEFVVIPSVNVNTFEVEGELSAENVFAAICSNFLSDAKPEVCSLCLDAMNVTECVSSQENGSRFEKHKTTKSERFLLLNILQLLLLVAIILVAVALGTYMYRGYSHLDPVDETSPQESELV